MSAQPPVDASVVLEALFNLLHGEGLHNVADLVHCSWQPESALLSVRAAGHARKRLCDLLDRMSAGHYSSDAREWLMPLDDVMWIVRAAPQ